MVSIIFLVLLVVAQLAASFPAGASTHFVTNERKENMIDNVAEFLLSAFGGMLIDEFRINAKTIASKTSGFEHIDLREDDIKMDSAAATHFERATLDSFALEKNNPNSQSGLLNAPPGSRSDYVPLSHTAKNNEAAESILAPIASPGWVVYAVTPGDDGCHSSGSANSIFVTSVPTNHCIVQYDKSHVPIGSARYSCDSAYATIQTYSDLQCNDEFYMETGNLPLGCALKYANYLFAEQQENYSANLECVVGTANEPPSNVIGGCNFNM
jgi:hypothetical protein